MTIPSITNKNILPQDVDTSEESARVFNDVYRVLRAHNLAILKLSGKGEDKKGGAKTSPFKKVATAIVMLCLLFGSVVLASVPWNLEYAGNADLMDAFMRNPQFKNMAMGTITLANGATIDNTVNDVLEVNEGGEDLLLTFSSNTVTLTSTLGVVLWDFALVVPKSDQFLFDPVSAAVGSVEGTVYYDSDDDNLYVRTSAGLVDLTATSTSTFDDIYNNSAAALGVTVDVNPIIWTAPNANDKVVMSFVQADTATTKAITITNAGTGNTIDIEGQATGKDIEGTGDTWNVTGAGAATFVSGAIPTLTSTTITLSNGGTIVNTTDTEIAFSENSEDLIFDFTTDGLTVKTTSGVAAINWADTDDFTGLNNLTFDASASAINLPANGANDDLTISVSGTQDSHLVISSAGTTEDAVTISTTNGGINITNNGAAAGEDIDLSSTAASINITAAEAVEDAIVITASTALGGIDITSNADIDITTTGASGEDISITNTGGSIAISATESAVDAVVIQSTVGGVQILAAGAADTEDILITATGSSIFITATQGVENAIVLNASTAAGGIDITSMADIDITTTGESGEDISITNTGGSIAISSTESATDAVVISSTIGGVQILAAGAADTEDILLTATGSSIFLTSTQAVADAIKLNASDAAGGITIAYGTGNLGITGSGASADFTLSCDLLSINATGTSNISFANGAGEDVTIATTGAADHSLIISATGTAADAMQIITTAGGLDITVTGAAGEDMDLHATTSSVNIRADEAVDDAISLNASAGGVDVNTSGAMANQFHVSAIGTIAGNAINLASTNGGIVLNAGGAANGDLTLTVGDDWTASVTGDTLLTAGGAAGITATAGTITLTQGAAGGVLVSTNAKTKRYRYFPIGSVSATAVTVGGGGSGNLCVGLTAGVEDIGTAEGYTDVDDDEDFLRFSIPMPDTWIDTGTQADLVLAFDILEIAAEEVNIDIRIFEKGNVSPILVDTLVVANGAGRAYVPLVTNATGIGNDTDIDGDDTLLIELTSTADADDFRIYGVRLTYRVGLQATQ